MSLIDEMEDIIENHCLDENDEYLAKELRDLAERYEEE